MASPSQVAFRIVGANGKKKSCVICVDAAHTDAQIDAFVLQIDQLLDDVIDGFIDEVTVTRQATFSVTGTTAADNRHVSHGGLLSFDATGIDLRHSLYIPTFALSLIDNNNAIANAGATAAFVTALLSGTNCDVTDRYGNDLSSFLSGRDVNRK